METQGIQNSGHKLTLRVDSGLSLGKVICLREGRSTLGRSVDAEIPVDDSRASRIHASIHEMDGKFFISDLGSTNGTFLNEVFLQESKQLNSSDKIRVGSTVLVVQSLETSKNEASPVWREPTKAIRLQDIPKEPLKNYTQKRMDASLAATLSPRSLVALQKVLSVEKTFLIKLKKFLDQNLIDFLSSHLKKIPSTIASGVRAVISPKNKTDQKKARLIVAGTSAALVLLAIFASL